MPFGLALFTAGRLRSRFGQTKPRRRRRGRGRGRELDRNHWEMYAAWRNKRKERGGKSRVKKREEHERAAAAGNKRGSKNRRMHSVGCARLRDWESEREEKKETHRGKPWEITNKQEKNKSTLIPPCRHLHYQCAAIKDDEGRPSVCVCVWNGRVYTV